MRVLMSGGGTGGHINPALAIAGKIKAENPDAVIEYVGTKKGLEVKLVPNEGYKLHFVNVRGFKRSLSFVNIDAAIKAVTSVIAAKKIIKEFRPDIVIGTGGYVSWPVLKAAAKKGIPTVIHEQNAVPGVTTQMLSNYVDKVMISFEASREHFKCDKDKLILVGNPIKAEMLNESKEEARRKLNIDDGKPVILSYGGSLGAAKINETVFDLIKNYSLKENVCHIHATGKASWAEMKAKYEAIGFKNSGENELKKGDITVREYIYNMPALMAAADVIICRGGAMTLSELAAMGKAAIIIPSPNVTNNHQYKNAAVLENAGAALVIEERNLSSDILINEVSALVADKEKISSLQKKIRKFAILDSLDKIYGIVKSLTK